MDGEKETSITKKKLANGMKKVKIVSVYEKDSKIYVKLSSGTYEMVYRSANGF